MCRVHYHLIALGLCLTLLGPIPTLQRQLTSMSSDSFTWPWPEESESNIAEPHSIAFDSYNTNGDGGIDALEFQHLFLSLFPHRHRHHVSLRKLEKIFHFLDLNGDKTIDREEFRKAFSHWLDRVLRPRTSLYMPICFKLPRKYRLAALSTLKEKLEKVSNVQHITLVDECNSASLCPDLETCFKPVEQEAQTFFPSTHIEIYKNCVDFPITHERSILFDELRLPFTKEHVEQKCQVQVLLDNQLEHDRHQVQSKVDLAVTLARKLYHKYRKFFTTL